MSLNELLKTKRAEILEIASRHGARNVRVFGSVARGEATENSDIDFLVELDKQTSLMDHAALVVDLDKVWKTTVNDLPVLQTQIEKLLRDMQSQSQSPPPTTP